MNHKLVFCFILFAFIQVKAMAQYATVHIEKHPENMEIFQIDECENSTVVLFKCIGVEGIDVLTIDEKICAKVRGNGKEYHLIHGINIPVSTQAETRSYLFDHLGQEHRFALEFEKIPNGETFDIIEDANDYYAFNFNGICIDASKTVDQVDINALCNDFPIKESGSFIRNNNTMQYVKANGITITAFIEKVKAYGKYYTVNMNIQNLSGKSILFSTGNVAAKGYLQKGDLIQKTVPLEVLSDQEYDKRVARKQSWNNIWVSLAEGMAAGAASYSSSYTTYSSNTNGFLNTYGSAYTTTYNGAAAYAAQQKASENTARFASEQNEVRQQLNDGYVKTNTIQDQVEYSGFFNIKYKKMDNIKLIFNINGVEFPFIF